MKKSKISNNLILFETALAVGLITIIIENVIANFSIHPFWKVTIMMLFFGGLFSIFFKYIEPYAEKAIRKIVNKRNDRRFLVHLSIIAIMFLLYSLFYFNLTWF